MRMQTSAIAILIALTGVANAQTAGGTSGPAGSSLGATPSPGSTMGTPNNSTIGTPPGASVQSPTSPSTGTGTTGSSVGSPSPSTAPPVAGVPNTSTPGTIGTGASPSGLPGDDPANPGYPRPLGNTR